jgi:FKBP-type peptidyl-prolyl cis-trans isomerase (trigger factor)
MRLTHLVPALLLGNHGVHRIARQSIAALPAASELTVSTEPLPQSAMRLTVEVSGKATQKAFDAKSGDAALSVASLLEEAVPSVLQEQQEQLRMIGQAELLQDPAKLISQFTPGQPLQVSFSVDVWPTLQLEPGSSRGLKFAMRRPLFEEDKYAAATLELQQRYASPEGELPALDDALANEVSEGSGLTWESLDALLRERVERESAIQDSKQAFRAAEEAMLAQLPMVELPETLLVERAREQFGKVIRKRQEEAKTGEEQAAVKQMLSWDAFQAYLEQERAELTRTLQLSFGLEAVAEAEELQIDPQALQDNLEMHISERMRQGEDKEGLMELKQDPAFRNVFEAQYVREVVLRWILDHADVEWTEQPAE